MSLTDCYIPLGHKPNWDGYIRVHHPTRRLKSGRLARIMLHRLKWEEINGEVPKGYSLHHICRNHMCCNVEHLVLMSNSDHARLHNRERYTDRKQKAKEYWKTHQDITGTKLGEMFGVSFSTGCKWIREWMEELV